MCCCLLRVELLLMAAVHCSCSSCCRGFWLKILTLWVGTVIVIATLCRHLALSRQPPWQQKHATLAAEGF